MAANEDSCEQGPSLNSLYQNTEQLAQTIHTQGKPLTEVIA